MSTLAEIEAAIDGLPAEELQAVVRYAQARASTLVAPRYFYSDAGAEIGEAELIAEADAAFLAYDLDEEANRK